jgi:subtilisin family serine protease
MKKLLTLIISVAVLFSVFGVWTPVFAADTDDSAAVADTLLIKFNRGSGKNDVPSLSGANEIGEIPGLGVKIMKVTNPKAIAALVAHNKHVEYAEPDYYTVSELTPNDPEFSWQTYLKNANALLGWDITSGSNSVIVAVIDSGVYAQHPDLTGRVLSGYNYIGNNQNTDDDYGHGTKVAGVIAAKGNNSIGIAGVDWNAKILPVKASDSRGTGTVSAMASAITYAADKGARVINISMGTTTDSATLKSAINYAENHGVVVVAATGNSNTVVSYPARYDTVIGVGNLTSSGARNSTSNYGTGINVGANGGVYSTTNYGSYESGAGTSFSAPQVAGLASLMLSLNATLTPSNIRNLIQEGAKNSTWSAEVGYGQIDIAATLKRVPGGGPITPPDTTPPVLTLKGANPISLFEGDTYVEPGYTAIDNVDGDITSKVTVSGTVATAYAGNYTLTYSVSDTAGNAATATRLITVKPVPEPVSKPPTITQVGSNPIILHLGGSPYIEQGAIAIDDIDGDISGLIVTNGNVNTSQAGTYQVTYSVTNSLGLAASITRAVRVLAPVESITRMPYSFSGQGKAGANFNYSAYADAAGILSLNVSGLNKTTVLVSVTDSSGSEVFSQSFAGNAVQSFWVEEGSCALAVTITDGNGNCSFNLGLLMPEVITMQFAEEEVPLDKDAPLGAAPASANASHAPLYAAILALICIAAAITYAYRRKSKMN